MSTVQILEDNKFRRRVVEGAGRRMNEEIFVDTESSVRNTSSRSDLRVGDGGTLIEEIFTNGYLINKCGGDELPQDFELHRHLFSRGW